MTAGFSLHLQCGHSQLLQTHFTCGEATLCTSHFCFDLTGSHLFISKYLTQFFFSLPNCLHLECFRLLLSNFHLWYRSFFLSSRFIQLHWPTLQKKPVFTGYALSLESTAFESHFIKSNNCKILFFLKLCFWTYIKISDVKGKQNSFTLTAALERPCSSRLRAKYISLPW